MILENFGRNVRFEPTRVLTPRTRDDVLQILAQYAHREIRAIGSLHSWSDAAACRGVVVDMRHFDRIAVRADADGAMWTDIEAGCTIDRALRYLNARGYTLPTHGVVGRQTIAGAVSTGTHGSGRRASLSGYLHAITVAAYDADSGRPCVFEWNSGDALRAARCALGLSGIVLSVRMPLEPDSLIEERARWFDRLDELLAHEPDYPRLQFYLVPWAWRWVAQLRGPVEGPLRPPARAALVQRALRGIGVDVLFNGAARALAVLDLPPGIRWLYRQGLPALARSDMRVRDRSRRVLMMRHDLYRHVEMELFVPVQHLAHAAAFTEWALRRCGGEAIPLPAWLTSDDFGVDPERELTRLEGAYVQDHVITFRQVLQDDALISMTGGGRSAVWYAISFITYRRDRTGFFAAMEVLARAMASAYGARPHWGKLCPLGPSQIAALYPELPRFRAHCQSVDPQGVFISPFSRRLGVRS